jgi:hypothetical protein
MSKYFRKLVCAMAIMMATFVSTQGAASWTAVIDPDLSDGWTNPGYPSNQSPATVAAYLQDLLDLTAALTAQSPHSTYSGGVLSGLGNPTAANTFFLALHFGNSNDSWEHDGPFNVFYSCQSDCDSFALPNAVGLGNYRLYSTAADPLAIPEPGTLALLGIGLAGLGFVGLRFSRREQ